ncbi:MAG: hypothetical protein QOF33_3564 [Thermomicrobiales bacterium]|jgi:uncharacterized protein (DUF983 family)|nr:hypothetical protein [Thermomicrobiales bacterium]
MPPRFLVAVRGLAGGADVLVRRAAGCLVALVVVPVGLAAAGTGYLVNERADTGHWGAALAWGVVTCVLGLVALALIGLAQRLLGRDGSDPSPPRQDA